MDNVELHPILETDCSPQASMWYVVSPDGKCPDLRVGHTLTSIQSSDAKTEGKSDDAIVLIGGANPDVTFADTHVLDLNSMEWTTIDSPVNIGRYEHSASTDSDKIFIFGGSSKSGSLNDVQCFNYGSKTWVSPDIKGKPPSSRTQHSTCCSDKGDLFVYSGGQQFSDPVSDRQVYVFVAAFEQWATISTNGVSPKPRHGHLMLFHRSCDSVESLYIHGGMSGSTFYEDMHQLKLTGSAEKRSGEWSEVKYSGSRAQKQKSVPCARAAHGGVVFDDSVYVFGGLSKNGAMNDMYRFDLNNCQWTAISYKGPGPSNRLDFGYCLSTLLLPPKSPQSGTDVEDEAHPADSSPANKDDQNSRIVVLDGADPLYENDESSGPRMEDLCLTSQSQQPQGDSGGPKIPFSMFIIHGGMDTEGHVFDDMLAFPLNVPDQL